MKCKHKRSVSPTSLAEMRAAARSRRNHILPLGVVPPATPEGFSRAWGLVACVTPAPRHTQKGAS